jgi:glutaconate CoA-transferase subunit B
MVGPVQVDRYGQSNISLVGDYARPKSAFLGVRGFPGNTINHANSMFVPNHSTRVFVPGEVDMVGGVGYNPARWPGGRKPSGLDLRLIVTDLAVLDFKGPDHQIRVASLHPGISFEQVQENTGFPLARVGSVLATKAPAALELELIRRTLDPHDLRATVFKGNPPGDRAVRP